MRSKMAPSETVGDFAKEIICEIMSHWGCDPAYYIGDKVASVDALAKNDASIIEFIESLYEEMFGEKLYGNDESDVFDTSN